MWVTKILARKWVSDMEIQLRITDAQMVATLPQDHGDITIDRNLQAGDEDLLLAASEHRIIASGAFPAGTDQALRLHLGWDIETAYLQKIMTAAIAGTDIAEVELPAGVYQNVNTMFTEIRQVLVALGYQFGQRPVAKKRPAKARHRFDRQLADCPFTVSRNGASATVFWRKAKEMEITAGAVLRRDGILNQDGSVSYGTKYGDKLRADHADAIVNGRTVKPVVLRSVNEMGLFLYYGDTNGWLELVDADGRTLDELTKVQ